MNQDRRSGSEKHRVNHRIKCPQVKVISDAGTVLGVFPTYKAQEMARDQGLDLVEVSPNSNPPVCKIMDYGKLKYDEKKAKVHHRQQKTKEIILRPGTDDHDFDFKLRHIIDFLKEGDKVHIRVKFRGRAIVHPEEGKKRLLEITAHPEVSPISKIEFGPRMEGRDMNLILAPAQKQKPIPQTTISGRTPSAPHIQNIPIRTEVGQQICDAFVGARTGRFDTSRPNMSNAPKPDPTAKGESDSMGRIPRESKVTPYAILGFFGPYRPFSNFHICKVWYDGDEYPSTEHAFHAAKVEKRKRKKLFRGSSPGMAKKIGGSVKIDVAKWNRKRVKVMIVANLAKYTTHVDLRALLLSTGSKYLEETNDWGDTFWGVCNGKGLNVLGRILMEIRSLLRYSPNGVTVNNVKAVHREVLSQISDLTFAMERSNDNVKEV